MRFGTDIHVSHRMNCDNFDDPLTFYLAPPAGQNFNLHKTLDYDQIPEKLMTLPAASVVFW